MRCAAGRSCCTTSRSSTWHGTVTGAEALARWQHPSRGVLAPAVFLGLIADAGLMGPFTMDVLDQALRPAGADGRARDTTSASRSTSRPPACATRICPTRSPHSSPRAASTPARVTLEITEDCFIADPEQALLVLERLRALGVELSIDDFGTGFSSLTYIRRLPVSELKLDRTFLTGAPRDKRAVAVIRSTVDLAHSLGLRIVAEGIENLEALALVDDLGCDAAQGYLMGRPVPAEDFDLAPVPFLTPTVAA